MKLSGSKSDQDNHLRVGIMMDYFKLCHGKVNHVDSLRQRNMSIALAICAVLFGFGLKTDGLLPAVLTAAVLTILMTTFCLLDRRLHKISHGCRDTADDVLTVVGAAIDSPGETVEFSRYKSASEAKAELNSLQPVLYYILIAVSILSSLAFWVVGS